MNYFAPTIPKAAGSGTFTFRPPKTNGNVIALAKALLPLGLRFVCEIRKVEIAPSDLERLSALRDRRVILAPNHPAGWEPFVLFHLSKLLGLEFNFLAAKETFERPAPLGWLYQRLGVYSVVRGTADRSSFRTTRQLLLEGRRWLVVFPEGEVCRQGDTILPFQQGAAQLAFWAYEELAERMDSPTLYFVPVAIRYLCIGDAGLEIDRSLSRLERKTFGASPSGPGDAYGRLRRIGEAVLRINEERLNLRPHKDATVNDRVQQLKEVAVSRVAHSMGVSLRHERPLIERIRDLFNEVDRVVYAEPQGTDYERRLQQQRQTTALDCYHDLWRVLRFIALYDGYVRETLTAERFFDIIGLIEIEVFGKQVSRIPKKAVLKTGEPQNLAAYFPRYRIDKRNAIREITRSLESSVRHVLAELPTPENVIS